ncbi:adenylate/guanylate cyclase domain-containing protein [Pseudanabaena sp. FACHB-2040]|uniref:adenylate/guanylate cyclase domain-containing protein n=1 Tax=Pseudanabaena sp. FACHB-2040 TaxID=2692859 RepID=UPI0016861DE7|nr:adenylate/guanylate cyclase domain-containing protein [Pseudanabaena sp. FACHB-2040]MBD2256057.1 GAF domain-containing protein [Pseudanabaena sp. FACHB-2040]
MPQLSAINAVESSKSTNQLASAQALSSRIAAINEIAVAVNRSLNVNEILKIVGKKSKWLIEIDHLSVYLISQESDSLVNLFGSNLELDQVKNSKFDSIHRALRSGQPQVVRQPSDMFWPEHKAAMIVPLENQRGRFGALVFSSIQPAAYTLDDVRIGYLLALQLSSAIQNAERFEEINRLYAVIADEQRRSEELLLNILPDEIAKELKSTGKVKPVYYKSVSVLFADFNGFTQLSESFTPEELVDELDTCFSYFDQVIDKYGLEKLKTIGDSYMCVGGIPIPSATHAVDAVLAAMEMQLYIQIRKAQKKKLNQPYWDVRIGIHSGPIMAGVIGRKKFAYDVWGDTVNIASRMESSGVPGKINISSATFELAKDFFEIKYRGKIVAKNKGSLDMFLVTGIQDQLSLYPGGVLPNHDFVNLYLARHPEAPVIETQKWISLAF